SSIGSATLNTSREPSRMKTSPISSMRRNQMPSTSTTKIGPVTVSEKPRLSRNDDMTGGGVGVGRRRANVHYRHTIAGPPEPAATSKETPRMDAAVKPPFRHIDWMERDIECID